METEVTLVNIAKGRAVELFDRTLQKVLENVADMATEAETKRKVVLEFTFEPNEDRSALITTVQAKATLAPITQVPTQVFLGAHKKNGRYVAAEYSPDQTPLFKPQEKPEPLRAVAGAPLAIDPATGQIGPAAQ